MPSIAVHISARESTHAPKPSIQAVHAALESLTVHRKSLCAVDAHEWDFDVVGANPGHFGVELPAGGEFEEDLVSGRHALIGAVVDDAASVVEEDAHAVRGRVAEIAAVPGDLDSRRSQEAAVARIGLVVAAAFDKVDGMAALTLLCAVIEKKNSVLPLSLPY